MLIKKKECSIDIPRSGVGSTVTRFVPRLLFPLCAFLFAFSILSSITPIDWMGTTPSFHHWPFTDQLFVIGRWLSPDWGLALPPNISQETGRAIMFISAVMLFVLCVLLAFLMYSIGAVLLYHRRIDKPWSHTLIWGIVLFVGSILVVSPIMLSHDIFVYGSYGRLLLAYHANPYFVPPITYHQDPLFALNDWSLSTAAYGPVWLLICAGVSAIAGSQAFWYVLIFRGLAFAAHLLNIILVRAILRKSQRSSHVITLGVYLYAWNPLVLMESCLGGHNDVFIVTLLLLGILFSLTVELRNSLSLRGYILPLVLFTLAALIKFTVVPVILLFVFLIVCKIRHAELASQPDASISKARSWYALSRRLLLAGALSGAVAFAFYFPFWIGHSPQDILGSFSSVPSTQLAENSILRAILLSKDIMNTSGWLLDILSRRSTWDGITVLAIACCCGIGALHIWRKPTTLTFVLAALATLSALLIVTPWFYPWYTLWLLGLAAICLPLARNRYASALMAFALIFSLSAFLIYFFSGDMAPKVVWEYIIVKNVPTVLINVGIVFVNTLVPPVLTFLVIVFLPKRRHQEGKTISPVKSF